LGTRHGSTGPRWGRGSLAGRSIGTPSSTAPPAVKKVSRRSRKLASDSRTGGRSGPAKAHRRVVCHTATTGYARAPCSQAAGQCRIGSSMLLGTMRQLDRATPGHDQRPQLAHRTVAALGDGGGARSKADHRRQAGCVEEHNVARSPSQRRPNECTDQGPEHSKPPLT
jgi:hypothetical protein